MRTLKPLAEYCTGCRLCLLGCSFHHEGVFSEALARLQVRTDEAIWRFEPIVCRQCPDAPCAESCPTSAISQDETTGAVILDAAACTGCEACVQACRYSVLVLNPDTQLVQLCDLCAGSPECVAACPHGALEYSS